MLPPIMELLGGVRDRRRALVRQPGDRGGAADTRRVHVVRRGAAADVRAGEEAQPRERQPAAGDRRGGAHLRGARSSTPRSASGPARRRCRRSASDRVPRRRVRLRRRQGAPDPARRQPDRPRGRDGGDRRAERRGQDDAGEPAAAVLRRHRRAHPDRRRRHPRRDARVAARADRHRDAGDGAVRRHRRAATSRTAVPARPRARDRGGRARGARARVHHGPARAVRHRDRRARPAALGRPAAAARDRARDPEELADPDPGRGDVGARLRVGAAGAGCAGEPDDEPDVVRDRAPALHDPPRRRDHRDGARTRRRSGPARRARDAPHGVYARLHSMQLLEGRRGQPLAPMLVEAGADQARVAVGEREDDR